MSTEPVTKRQKTEETKTMDMANYPVVDLAKFLEKKEMSEDCETIVNLLHTYGLLVIRDPRVCQEDQDNFLNMMEQYFEQEPQKKQPDIRPEISYQLGATPSGVEQARNHCSRIASLEEDDQPLTLCPPEVDPKWRFFWRMGETPKETEFKQLNESPVIPAAFPQWSDVMNRWGTLMLEAVSTVAEMLGLGVGGEVDTFTKKMKYGPHLLAPTGSNFHKLGVKGRVMANYHYDLNFLTIHGRSRFPGLFVWTRDGRKMEVKVPPGCLLVQAGQQSEWLTGGHLLAGFHEVVVSDRSMAAIEKAKEEGRSLWRVSSTLFAHIASDQVLEPLEQFKNEASTEKYPPTKAGKQVSDELAAIKLGMAKADTEKEA